MLSVSSSGLYGNTRRAKSLPPSTYSSSYHNMSRPNPRYGPLRSALNKNNSTKENFFLPSSLSRGRKTQRFSTGGGNRRSNGLYKMDGFGKNKKIPDYTDIAYREAVSRLRYLLNESSYTSPHRSVGYGYRSADEGDTGADIIERTRALLSPYRRPPYRRGGGGGGGNFISNNRSPNRILQNDNMPPDEVQTAPTTPRATSHNTHQAQDQGGQGTLPPEMLSYIERQEEYIDQLEKESQFCREELSGLLNKVKEVISENEGLHEKQKSGLLRSVVDYLPQSDRDDDDEEEDTETSEIEPRLRKHKSHHKRHMEGPNIMFESRISELEAQLTQVRVELKKAQDEADDYKRRLLGEGLLHDSGIDTEPLRQQLEKLKREKSELLNNVSKLQTTISQMRDRDSDAGHKLKRAQEATEQAQYDKTQSDLEIRRLKDELERLHSRLRDSVAEQGRRVADERAGVERRYQHQSEQLQAELSNQWDNASRLQLELDKQKRIESELRRELANKIATIDDMAKDAQSKIGTVPSSSLAISAA